MDRLDIKMEFISQHPEFPDAPDVVKITVNEQTFYQSYVTWGGDKKTVTRQRAAGFGKALRSIGEAIEMQADWGIPKVIVGTDNVPRYFF